MSRTITDDQFKAWLDTPGKFRCALFRLTFLGSSDAFFTSSVERHAYLSNAPFVSTHSDSLPDQQFDDCVLETPTFTRRMSDQLFGRSSLNYGDLILSNENNSKVVWWTINWDGRRIEQWLGDPSWTFDDFRLVMDGIIVDIFDPGGSKIGFHLSDKAALLDRPIQTALLGGSGPDANSLMPLQYGIVKNITPKLIDEVNHIYRVSATTGAGLVEAMYGETGYPGDFPADVRENGASLYAGGTLASSDAATDLLHVPGHGFVQGTRIRFLSIGGALAPAPLVTTTVGSAVHPYWVIWNSGMGSDDFKVAATLADALAGGPAIDVTGAQTGTPTIFAYNWTSLGDGTFQVVTNPAGLITCDSYGLNVGGSASWTAGDIAQQVLTSAQTNTPFTSSDIDATAMSAFVAAATRSVGIYITEQMTFAELLDQLALSVGAWWGFSRAGKFQMGLVRFGSGSLTPVLEITEDDIASRSMQILRRILPRASVTLKGGKNYTVQNSVAGSVPEYLRAYWASEGVQRVGLPVSPHWYDDPNAHKNAVHPDPQETLLIEGDVQLEATRLALMFQVQAQVVSFEMNQSAFLLDIDSPIHVTHPKAGGDVIVVGITEKVRGRSVVEFLQYMLNYYPTSDL